MQLFTIIIMEILTGAEVDLFVPSFPELQQIFELSPFMVELTLGVNLIAHCLSALIVGNLGDRYGRKSIILIGLIIFILGSITCIFAHAFWQLLFGRFLQGIGISAPGVLAYVIVADMYSTSDQQKLMGILNGVVTLSMAFAPVLGSYVNLYFNWQGNFVMLLSLGVICFILGIIYIPKGKANYNITISLKEYIPIITSKKANYYIATISFFTLGYWIFIGMAPIFYMGALGVNLKEFGFYQGAMAAVLSFFSLTSSFFLKYFGEKKCFYIGIGLTVLFMFFSVILMILSVKDPLIITLTSLLLAAGIIFPCNILYPYMLETVENAKGRLAAFITTIRGIFLLINLQITSYFYNDTFLYIGIAMSLNILLALGFSHKLLKQNDLFINPNPHLK